MNKKGGRARYALYFIKKIIIRKQEEPGIHVIYACQILKKRD